MQKSTAQEITRYIFLLCYALMAAGFTLFTLYICYAIEWRGPFRDLWEFLDLIQAQLNGNWDFNPLIEPYGGIHRILIPKLLFYLDYRFASGSNMLALSVTLALHISACALLIYLILVSGHTRRKDVLLLVSTVLLFFFSTTQIYNLIYISDNQVVISNSLAIFAAYIFCQYLHTGRSTYLFLSNAIILLACLSHSSSLMLLLAMIGMMLMLKKPKQEIVIQTTMAIFLLGAYISGYDPLEKSIDSLPMWKKIPATIYAIMLNASGILRYIGLHLSSPTSRDYPTIGIIISYLSIVYLFVIGYRVNTKRWQPSRNEALWITLACYGFFIAVITACGRQIYPNSALTDRYQTLVMTYWAAIIILACIDLERNKPKFRYLPPILALILLLPYQYKNAEAMAWLSSRVNIAHTAATVGITNMDTVAATLSHPLLMDKKNLVEKHNDFLRDRKLGYFGEKNAEYFLVKNTHPVFTEVVSGETGCEGSLLSMEEINHDAIDYKFLIQRSAGKVAINYILVLDNQQRVVGMGRKHRQKGELLPQPLRDQATQQWIGFIHSTQEYTHPLTFIAKTTNGYCEVFKTI